MASQLLRNDAKNPYYVVYEPICLILMRNINEGQ